MLREGDILYERNELVKIKKVDIVILDMPLLDTTKYKDMNGLENLISDIILQLLSYMNEDERTRIKERQKEGIKAALDKGIKFGRRKIEPGDNFEEVYKKWKNNELTAVNAMKLLDSKSNTFYRRFKEYES